MMAPARPSMRSLVSTDSGGSSRKRFESAVDFHLGRLAGHEQQIRNPLGALNHGRQQPVEFFCWDRFHHSDFRRRPSIYVSAPVWLAVGSSAGGEGLQLCLDFPRLPVEETGLQQISDPQHDFGVINRFAEEIVGPGRHCLAPRLGRVFPRDHQHRQKFAGRRRLPQLLQNGEPVQVRACLNRAARGRVETVRIPFAPWSGRSNFGSWEIGPFAMPIRARGYPPSHRQ